MCWARAAVPLRVRINDQGIVRSSWHTAWTARCPRCDEGKIFTGFLKPVEKCDRCGLEIAAMDSGDGPAVFLIFILGAVAVLGAILMEIWFTPPYWLQMVIWPPVILGLTVGTLRPVKALVIAMNYKHRQPDRK